jgi:hypothetical protein
LHIVTEEDEPRAGTSRRVGWRLLLEAQTTVLDDIARAFTGYPVLGRGTNPLSFTRTD